jgi:hypothetical protein
MGLPTMNQFENPFMGGGGSGLYPAMSTTPGVVSNGTNNPNVIVVDTNQLTTRSDNKKTTLSLQLSVAEPVKISCFYRLTGTDK